MYIAPTKEEVLRRIERLRQAMDRLAGGWDAVFLLDKVTQYYFTGTMQDGLFVLKGDGSFAYYVRRSYDRAKREALIDEVFPMATYRDVLPFAGSRLDTLYLDKNAATVTHLERLRRVFDIGGLLGADPVVQAVRGVKSPYELDMMRQAGRWHRHLLQSVVPGLLREGMDEASLTAELYREMIALGHHGVARFAMFQTEIVVGQLGFGDNGIYPSYFDGPGGMKGMSPAVPIVGDRERRLRKGDLVFVDFGCGCSGYHSDCTQVYSFGARPDPAAEALHSRCLAIQKAAAAMLRPGAIPEEIYARALEGLEDGFFENFMGLGDGCVKFLGHGVGLQIDEHPVIAPGFREPLAAGMAIALEPKKSIPGMGIVGVEDTFVVTESGGECITGGQREIMVV